MSLLGFDAIARQAIGQISYATTVVYTLTADAGAFSVAGQAATFTVLEVANVGAFSVAGVSASFTVSWPNAAGAWSWAGVAAPFTITEATAAGAFTINGQPANEFILVAESAGAFVVTYNPANLVRTGFDYDFQQGGIGHYLEELERAKQLAAITRTIPPPVDTRTAAKFGSIGRPPIAPNPAPVDLSLVAQRAMGGQMQVAQAQAARKRRNIEALLLLAS